MELMFNSVQSTSVIFTATPLLLALQNMAAYRVYSIHILIAVLEITFINFLTKYKFCILHQLMHEVKPLYAMSHVEHHICKSIYPTSATIGLWEILLLGLSPPITTAIGLLTPPWIVLQTVFAGVSIVVHTMWPAKCLLQWHTLHHTILADVYNTNIPSPYDKQYSKSVEKLQSQLERTSPFIRYEAISDIAAFGFMVAIALLLHYGFNTGIGQVDWSKADWIYY